MIAWGYHSMISMLQQLVRLDGDGKTAEISNDIDLVIDAKL